MSYVRIYSFAKSLKGDLPSNSFIVKTIVSTKLANLIAGKYNVEVEEVLTGFKFIGEKIRILDEFGNKKFLFGFEESYGYLIGTYARDKDGVSASMMIAEIGAYYKSKGMTLWNALQNLYTKYGYVGEGVFSFTLEGKEGLEKIKDIMQKLRDNMGLEDSGDSGNSKNLGSLGNLVGLEINGYQIISISDYLSGVKYNLLTGCKKKLSLPSSNVLYYELSGGSWFCIRPSGTEPKIKIYLETFGNDMNNAKERLADLKEKVFSMLKNCCEL